MLSQYLCSANTYILVAFMQFFHGLFAYVGRIRGKSRDEGEILVKNAYFIIFNHIFYFISIHLL